MTTDLDLLLAAVLAEPDEDTPRLVYADALDERGGPGDVERAEFVRVQVELARPQPVGWVPPIDDAVRWGADLTGVLFRLNNHDREKRLEELRARERELLEAARDWLSLPGLRFTRIKVPTAPVGRNEYGEPVFGWRETWGFATPAHAHLLATPARGFVEAVTCSAADWIAHADELLAAHPVRRVTWTEFRHEDRVAIGRRFATSGVRITAGRLYADSGAELWPRVEFTLPPPPVEVGPDGGFLLPDAEFLPALLAATGSVAGDPIAIPPPPS